jgi:MFS family permease
MIDIALLSLVLLGFHLFVPGWFWIAALPFLYGLLFAKTAPRALIKGAAAGGLVWTGSAAYLYFGGAQLIAGRIGGMFGLRPRWLMVLVTGALGALVAGAAALFGRWVRVALAKKSA